MYSYKTYLQQQISLGHIFSLLIIVIILVLLSGCTPDSHYAYDEFHLGMSVTEAQRLLKDFGKFQTFEFQKENGAYERFQSLEFERSPWFRFVISVEDGEIVSISGCCTKNINFEEGWEKIKDDFQRRFGQPDKSERNQLNEIRSIEVLVWGRVKLRKGILDTEKVSGRAIILYYDGDSASFRITRDGRGAHVGP